MEKKRKMRLLQDALIVVVSIALAIAFAQTPYIGEIVSWADNQYILAAFLVGIFFTSAFTTAPAIAILAQLTLAYDPYVVAIAGGAGALLGDLIIFSFIKSHVREDVSFLLAKAKSRRVRHILERRLARWSLAFLGAIVIASPLPDELGLAMMGLSNVRTSRFIPVSFAFNTIGILLIAFIAHSV